MFVAVVFHRRFCSTITTTPSSPSSPSLVHALSLSFPSLVHALSLPQFSFLAPPPLPHFGKFCAKGKVSRNEKKARCQSIQNNKKARCQCIKQKKEKEGKEKPHHTRQQNYIWGAGLFPCWAPPPFPVLGFGAIFFLISDCLVLERRIPAVVSHPDLGAGLPLWTGTHQGASPLGRPHLCYLCTFTLVSSNIATCLALLFNLALLFDCANPCN